MPQAKHSSQESKRRAYQAKRKFRSTPEPSWTKTRRRKSTRGKIYVIQKHAARRLHYDLRLEIDGALASWAIPKGIPLEHGLKNLAIKVEDHPMEYGDFEGNIPPGNYGAGTVMLWDRGLYEILEDDPHKALDKGHLSLVFAGEKLSGLWTLVRTRSKGDKEEWLLIKGKENDFTLPQGEDDRSVASGRSLDQIAAEAEDSSEGSKVPAKKRRTRIALPKEVNDLPSKTPGFLSPMKPHLSAHLPRAGNWIYEIKFDGYRIVAVKNGDDATLFSRTHKDVSREFAEIRDAIAALPTDRFVLDGEGVALLDSGLSSFQLLQNRRGSRSGKQPPLYFYAFDLLNLQGHDVTGLPLHARKDLLRKLLGDAGDPLRFSAGLDTDPAAFLEQARKLGLEGLIAKEAESRYQVGRRTRSWLKIKLQNQQEFVIGGYTPPKGSRSHFGALLVGYYQGKDLHYAARVGTGFDERTLAKAFETFQPLRSEQCPFVNLPAPRKGPFGLGLTQSEMKRCTWLEPKLVCEIRYSEWTEDDSLRQPVFLGFRDDKPAREVKKEKAA